jgi:hypothetical protein
MNSNPLHSLIFRVFRTNFNIVLPSACRTPEYSLVLKLWKPNLRMHFSSEVRADLHAKPSSYCLLTALTTFGVHIISHLLFYSLNWYNLRCRTLLLGITDLISLSCIGSPFVNPLQLTGYYMYHMLLNKLHFLPTQCISVFQLVLTLNRDYFFNDINSFIFKKNRRYVSCEVWTEFLYIALKKCRH